MTWQSESGRDSPRMDHPNRNLSEIWLKQKKMMVSGFIRIISNLEVHFQKINQKKSPPNNIGWPFIASPKTSSRLWYSSNLPVVESSRKGRWVGGLGAQWFGIPGIPLWKGWLGIVKKVNPWITNHPKHQSTISWTVLLVGKNRSFLTSASCRCLAAILLDSWPRQTPDCRIHKFSHYNLCWVNGIGFRVSNSFSFSVASTAIQTERIQRFVSSGAVLTCKKIREIQQVHTQKQINW